MTDIAGVTGVYPDTRLGLYPGLNRPRLGYTLGILWPRQRGIVHTPQDHNISLWSVGLNWP